MQPSPYLRRFNAVDRATHLLLIVTFMVLALSGFGRTYAATPWGQELLALFGGYERATRIHVWTGWVMALGLGLHVLLLSLRIDWRRPLRALLGPDSLVPVWRDVRQFGQQFRWFLGFGHGPRFGRWTYLEKFDYWAVFWGIGILFGTGLMLMYPVETSRILPGWTLNVAALLHRAEAVLAVSYIVVVHLVFGHFRRSTFPMNEAMFAGGLPLDHAAREKPEWVQQLHREGRLAAATVREPAPWFRLAYILFGYSVIALGLYLVVSAVYYSPQVNLH